MKIGGNVMVLLALFAIAWNDLCDVPSSLPEAIQIYGLWFGVMASGVVVKAFGKAMVDDEEIE